MVVSIKLHECNDINLSYFLIELHKVKTKSIKERILRQYYCINCDEEVTKFYPNNKSRCKILQILKEEKMLMEDIKAASNSFIVVKKKKKIAILRSSPIKVVE
jgi:hypothetical protein